MRLNKNVALFFFGVSSFIRFNSHHHLPTDLSTTMSEAIKALVERLIRTQTSLVASLSKHYRKLLETNLLICFQARTKSCSLVKATARKCIEAINLRKCL